jgi:hypothetical protein
MEATVKSQWVMAGVLALAGGCSNMNKNQDEKVASEVKMTLDQVPAPAREALVREAKGAAIDHVDKETLHDGKVVYETDVKQDGKNWEIKVDEAGKLVSRKLD